MVPHKYNLELPRQFTEFELEQVCFFHDHKVENGGLGRYGHLRNIAKVLCPWVIWNPWLEKAAKAFCDDFYAIKSGKVIQRYLTFWGCATSGKTFSAAFLSFIWWSVKPDESVVIHTSTSLPAVRRRIWPVIQDIFSKCPISPGNLVDSETMLQFRKGDHKHGMMAVAVDRGDIQKARSKIQGVHAPRVMVIVDEATDCPEAIVSVCENLNKGCQEFVLLMVGNPVSWSDPLGKAGTPKAGINSVGIGDDEWITKRGLCVRFDGLKSPNVRAGKTLYPFLYSWEDHLIDLQERKEDSIEHWMFVRGFPAPEGVGNTVMSEALITMHDGRGAFSFYGAMTPVAGLDPAFGGDGCILKFGKIGDTEYGAKTVLQLTDTVEIKPKANVPEPKDYQIARQVIHECSTRNVQPQHFRLDSTGTGRGVFAILQEEWSTQVTSTEFGGAPPDVPSSEVDKRSAKEVYDRKVSWLWYSVRELLVAGQLRGMTTKEEDEFTKRRYFYKNKKISIETKEDYKLRCQKSPDHADAVSVLVDLVRDLGLSPRGKVGKQTQQAALAKAREYNQLYEDESDGEPSQDLEVEVLFEPWD